MDIDTRNDEQAIRALIREWIDATKAGDIERVLPLMTEDVVFLRAGQPPMRGRNAFAEALRMGGAPPLIEGEPEVQEIQVSDALASCWTYLAVTITPPRGSGRPPSRRRGHILSVFRKDESGRWALWRDANLLTPDPEGEAPAK